MDFGSLEELLLLNKAAIFDGASLCFIAGLILLILNIRLASRWLSAYSAWILVLAVAIAGCLWILECHYSCLARDRHRISPYLLSGYYTRL